MPRRRFSLSRFATLPAVLLALIATAVAVQAATSSSGDLRKSFDQKLSAGDVEGALAICKQQGDATQRDSWLAEVTAYQLKNDSFGDALSTAALIKSDLTRSKALREVVEKRPKGGKGGGANFGQLINLITQTIAPDSWDDAGGEGSIQQYSQGVWVDAQGVLRRTTREDAKRWLTQFHAMASRPKENSDARRASHLRKVSLTRLERAVELRSAAGKPLDPEMLTLAGLERIQYVLVYPETGDLVLAGPAGDWKVNEQSRIVSAASGHPVVRLDDLITVFRHTANRGKEAMGCSISPLQENLAAAKAFLDESQKKPLKRGGRTKWLEEVRSRVGQQRVDVFGVDPTTRVAQVLVEADYHMKLVGLGIEESVLGVPSYLEMVEDEAGAAPPALDVLRWWFTMKYDVIESSAEHDTFAIRGQAVQLQSENQMLTAQGKQVHTNQAEPLNRRFAENFTRHFAALAAKYPVYGELQNLFDLAMVGTLIETEGLADQVGWHRTCFGVGAPCDVPHGTAPKMVDTVANHRLIGGRTVIAGVSGGVSADPLPFVRAESIKINGDGMLDSQHHRDAPLAELPADTWWWD